MTSRDDFIAQLIAALEEKEALAGDSPESAVSAGTDAGSLFAWGAREAASGSTDETLARRAYEALQFDFPVVDDAQLLALAATYHAIVEKKKSLADVQRFALTAKMIEAIEYLNDSLNKRRGTEASGLLAAAMLILIPRFCLEFPDDPSSAALLQQLRPPPSRPLPATPAEQQSRIEQYAHSMESSPATNEEQFSADFVEVYAAEEDPDDLSLVYEGSTASSRSSASAVAVDISIRDPHSSTTATRCTQLHFLASKTYSTCFSLIPSDKWIAWRLEDALCALSRCLVETTPDDSERDGHKVFGVDGEWQRYLFVLRDQLLRFSESSETCAGGLAKLRSLVVEDPNTTAQHTSTPLQDPFFAFSKPSVTVSTSNGEVTTQRVRIVFRILAELAVSKEFNSLAARKSQHVLATTVQQLFPSFLRELQALSSQIAQPSFEADHSDFVIVLLQLLHFVVDAAGATAASHQHTVDKLQDSGLLRTWLTFLPPVDASPDWPWLAPLLRLFGESALWNAEFAAYVHRVPKVSKLLQTTQEENDRLVCEAVLLLIAAHQQNVPLGKTAPSAMWKWFSSEHVFPSSCQSFIESMDKMSNALFLLDALAKAVSTLRPQVANELRASLQSIYSTRFMTAFEYPTFSVPTPTSDAVESVNKDEPEPPPREEVRAEEEKQDEAEERGRAEALQFLALRNRLRQCAKAILLSRMAGSSSSSKLD